MRVWVNLRGDSAAVRLPASIMAAASLRIGQEVEVREERGRIVLESLDASRDDLDALLAGMTPDSFPDVIDFGPPLGNEIW